MRCKNYKEKIILYLYGELDEKGKAEVESHIRQCADCGQDLAYTRKVFKALDEAQDVIPEATWEKCWKEINTGIAEKPVKEKSFFALPRWAYATAAVLVIFAAGMLIGRFWLGPAAKASRQPAALSPLSAASYQPALQNFIEDLKPVLVEYANYSAKNEKEVIVMDKEVARNLIIQNILLRRIVAEKNPNALQFLEDVDIVLKEIANLKSSDQQTPSLIKEFIEQRGILFKMEIFRKI
jgi:hypothetical protein